jgi:hypothetical protein
VRRGNLPALAYGYRRQRARHGASRDPQPRGELHDRGRRGRHDLETPLLLNPSSEVRKDGVASRELAIQVVELHAGVLEKDQSSEAIKQREEIDKNNQEEETDVNAVLPDEQTLVGRKERSFAAYPEDSQHQDKSSEHGAIRDHAYRLRD